MKLVDGLPPYRFGPKLSSWRELHGISDEPVAKALGVSIETYRAIEARMQPPPASVCANYRALAAFMLEVESCGEGFSFDEQGSLIQSLYVDSDRDRLTHKDVPASFYAQRHGMKEGDGVLR